MAAAEDLAPLATVRPAAVYVQLGGVITLAEGSLASARSEELLDFRHLGAPRKPLKTGPKGLVPSGSDSVKMRYQQVEATSEGKPKC